MMSRSANGYLAQGLRTIAERKAVIVWVWLAYLGFYASAWFGAAATAGPVTDFSFYARRMGNGFDVITLFELLGRQEIVLGPLAVRGLIGGAFLGLLLWFCQAGVLAEFLSPESLGAERFFQACGAYWWRFVRLILLTWLILLPTMGILAGIRTAMVDAADKSWHLRLPFVIFMTASVIIQLIGLVLRGWFDTAEFDAIHHDRAKVRRSIGEARRLTRGYRLQILWIYLVPAIVMWAITCGLIALWLATPGGAVKVSFLLMQVIILVWITCRMWERAAQAHWFLDHTPEIVPATLPITESAVPEAAPPPPDLGQPEMDLP
jgi:hypothetical protein